jgi:hypothetical protein
LLINFGQKELQVKRIAANIYWSDNLKTNYQQIKRDSTENPS